MKTVNIEYERIHVLNADEDVSTVMKDLSKTQEESFFILNIDDIVQKHKNWVTLLPRVTPHYAVKCNDSLIVLEILAALGAGFDCASKNEIDKVLALGVEPNRIIFANPARPISHIQHASDVGVNTLTFDNEVELHKVKELFPDAKMVIRIRCDAKASKWQLGLKFGCDPVTEAPYLLQLARELKIDVIGVSFHVGSGCQDPPAFREAISISQKFFDYAATLGYHFYLLDIGGGYPGETGTSIVEMADVINKAIDDYFPDPSVHIISEPGRYYVASAYSLACNVHSIRRIPTPNPVSDEPSFHYMYYMNDGVYSSFNGVLFDNRHMVGRPLKNCTHANLYSSTLWGPTCDSLDLVNKNILLPKLNVGDWLVFEDMGAYTLPAASTFNGFPIAKAYAVVSESTWLFLKNVLAVDKDNVDSDEHWPVSNLPISVSMPVHDQNLLLHEHVFEYIDVSSILDH